MTSSRLRATWAGFSRPSVLAVGFIEPRPPTKADTLPSGGLWIRGIKHDRVPHQRPQQRRAGEALQPSGQFDRRFLLIVETLANLHTRS
jgi:hypothetical protein